MNEFTKNVFSPSDLTTEIKIVLLNPELPDDENLFDKFINYFRPYINDCINPYNDIEFGRQNWNKDKIFRNPEANNNILFEGKIYGFCLDIDENFGKKVDIKVTEFKEENITFLSTQSFMYKDLLISGKAGNVFIPLIPSRNEANQVVSFNYPSYFQDEIGKLPSLDTINNHTTIVILDVYNFILSYFAGMDNLTILSYCNFNWRGGYGKIVHGQNTVTYGVPIDDSIEEQSKLDIYQWMQCKPAGRLICVLPLINLTLYYNSMSIPCPIPTHIQKFFGRQLKCDKYSLMTKNGYFFWINKNQSQRAHDVKINEMCRLFKHDKYLTDNSKNSEIAKAYRNECQYHLGLINKKMI